MYIDTVGFDNQIVSTPGKAYRHLDFTPVLCRYKNRAQSHLERFCRSSIFHNDTPKRCPFVAGSLDRQVRIEVEARKGRAVEAAQLAAGGAGRRAPGVCSGGPRLGPLSFLSSKTPFGSKTV